MPRAPAAERPDTRQALRKRRIAAYSTPATLNSTPTGLRLTLDQSCQAKDVILTEERRRLAMIFDETDAPLSIGEVWERARGHGLKASRSHVYQLVRSLVASGVLIIAENSQTLRYATPLAARLRIRDGDQAVTAIDDPFAVEALIGALLRAGRVIEDRDLIIDLVARRP